MTPPLNWMGSMRVAKAQRKRGRHSFAIFSGASLKTPGGKPSVPKALPAKRCLNTKTSSSTMMLSGHSGSLTAAWKDLELCRRLDQVVSLPRKRSQKCSDHRCEIWEREKATAPDLKGMALGERMLGLEIDLAHWKSVRVSGLDVEMQCGL